MNKNRFVTHAGEMRPAGERRRRLTVRTLLRELHVENATHSEQRAAVAGWLDEGNRPDRVLRAGLERHKLLPLGADYPIAAG